jgi:hypothetical protein
VSAARQRARGREAVPRRSPVVPTRSFRFPPEAPARRPRSDHPAARGDCQGPRKGARAAGRGGVQSLVGPEHRVGLDSGGPEHHPCCIPTKRLGVLIKSMIVAGTPRNQPLLICRDASDWGSGAVMDHWPIERNNGAFGQGRIAAKRSPTGQTGAYIRMESPLTLLTLCQSNMLQRRPIRARDAASRGF